ncbi:MAG: mechanosensitive ion channel family protein [Candidatus Diapherotrites archaeon]|nr:mechanosensitive ion channel family protein [Candidatus Diapherotrites archaeon]
MIKVNILGMAEPAFTFPLEVFLTVLLTLLQILLILIVMYFVDKSIKKINKRVKKLLSDQFHIYIKTQVLEDTLRVGLWLVAGVMILGSIPGVSEVTLAVLSLGVAAIVAFSSTSIIANLMNGVMINLIKPFKVGDVVELKDTPLGVVINTGFLHTKVETPYRHVISVPNAVIMTGTIKNYTRDNYIANASVSIGYDTSRAKVEKALLDAAKHVKLKEPFVFILELGDFAVTYQLNGTTADVSNIVMIESNLKKAVIDACYEAEIEITSPNYMVQRQIPKAQDTTIPKRYRKAKIETKKKSVVAEIAKKAIKEDEKKKKAAKRN